MDNGLVHIKDNGKEGKARSLNPFCNGQWYRTLVQSVAWCYYLSVLILIVVDNGLVQVICLKGTYSGSTCLNPYCSGRWSRTNINTTEITNYARVY